MRKYSAFHLQQLFFWLNRSKGDSTLGASETSLTYKEYRQIHPHLGLIPWIIHTPGPPSPGTVASYSLKPFKFNE